jgi:predicted nucleic acid-binding protein
LAERAAKLIESDLGLQISVVTLAEVAFVLKSVYKVPRETVVDTLNELISRDNISMHGLHKALVTGGLMMCRASGRVSIPDALLWAVARSSSPAVVYTFDRKFPSSGIELREE